MWCVLNMGQRYRIEIFSATEMENVLAQTRQGQPFSVVFALASGGFQDPMQPRATRVPTWFEAMRLRVRGQT
ncbi:MAG: hypothetical protein VX127_05155 [Myxococcota bacterium]|nr:hypothetical protein [Myxococcota bacterium]